MDTPACTHYFRRRNQKEGTRIVWAAAKVDRMRPCFSRAGVPVPERVIFRYALLACQKLRGEKAQASLTRDLGGALGGFPIRKKQ